MALRLCHEIGLDFNDLIGGLAQSEDCTKRFDEPAKSALLDREDKRLDTHGALCWPTRASLIFRARLCDAAPGADKFGHWQPSNSEKQKAPQEVSTSPLLHEESYERARTKRVIYSRKLRFLEGPGVSPRKNKWCQKRTHIC